MDVTWKPEARRMWVVSTAHVTEKDGRLMYLRGAPLRVGEWDACDPGVTQGPAILFRTIDTSGKLGDLDSLEDLDALYEFGFSEEFIDILSLGYTQDMQYVLFDRDGPVMRGLHKFDW